MTDLSDNKFDLMDQLIPKDMWEPEWPENRRCRLEIENSHPQPLKPKEKSPPKL